MVKCVGVNGFACFKRPSGMELRFLSHSKSIYGGIYPERWRGGKGLSYDLTSSSVLWASVKGTRKFAGLTGFTIELFHALLLGRGVER